MSEQSIQYPRVLILAQNKIQPFTGGGVVLSNLFGGFPEDSLTFLHRDQEYEYCTPYKEHRLIMSWLRFHPLTFILSFSRWLMAGLRKPNKLSIRDLARLFAQSCHFYLPADLHTEIKTFDPEIVYAWVGDSLWAETLRVTAMRYNLPYVVHFMDNHVGLNPETPVEQALYQTFQKKLNAVASGAQSLYVISDSMGKAYQTLWNKPYEVYHGVIETEQWPLPNISHRLGNGIYRVAFTGSIEEGQLLGLKDVAQAIEQLLNKGRDIRLVLYLTQAYAARVESALGRYKCLEIRPHPEFSDLRAELASVDALILAYGMDERTINYYRYSFATKIVPYMLSGRPILIYGPKTIEPIKYAIAGGWALNLMAENESKRITELTIKISNLIDNPESAKLMAQKAWEAGVLEHDLHENSSRFISSLREKSKNQ